MKKDEYSTARPIMKHRSNRSPTIEPGRVLALDIGSSGICQLHKASESLTQHRNVILLEIRACVVWLWNVPRKTRLHKVNMKKV